MKKVLVGLAMFLGVMFSGAAFGYSKQDLTNGTLMNIYPNGKYCVGLEYEWYDAHTLQMKDRFLKRKNVAIVSIIIPKTNISKYDIVENVTVIDPERYEKKVIEKRYYKNGNEVRSLRTNCLKNKSTRWESFGRDDQFAAAVYEMTIFYKLATYEGGGD